MGSNGIFQVLLKIDAWNFSDFLHEVPAIQSHNLKKLTRKCFGGKSLALRFLGQKNSK